MSTRRERAEKRRRPFFSVCPNCGGKGPHFIPPSFGDPGFYACEAIEATQVKPAVPTAEETAK